MGNQRAGRLTLFFGGLLSPGGACLATTGAKRRSNPPDERLLSAGGTRLATTEAERRGVANGYIF